MKIGLLVYLIITCCLAITVATCLTQPDEAARSTPPIQVVYVAPSVPLPTAAVIWESSTHAPKFVPSNTPVPTHTLTPTPTLIPIYTATSTHVPVSTPTPDALREADALFIDDEDCRSEQISKQTLPTLEISISSPGIVATVIAEIADESTERMQGLMCRDQIPNGTGMLFVFDRPSTLGFWMFRTYVPIDIVYIDSQKKPLRALAMSPCPRQEGKDDSQWISSCREASRGYSSGEAAQFALELPAGWLESIGIGLDEIMEAKFEW